MINNTISEGSKNGKVFIVPKIFVLVFLLNPISSTKAQSDVPDGPLYQVQEGDSLWDIGFVAGFFARYDVLFYVKQHMQ